TNGVNATSASGSRRRSVWRSQASRNVCCGKSRRRSSTKRRGMIHAAAGLITPTTTFTVSPQALDAVGVEHAVVGDDLQILDLRLRDQHPIEWIAMFTGQPARALCVHDRDVERRESLARDGTCNVRSDVGSAWKFAEPILGRNLPGRRGAHEDRVLSLADGGARAARQAAIAVEPPEQR